MWAGRALTETPADRPRAEDAVCRLYELLGKEKPCTFMWVKSPAAMKKVRVAFDEIRDDPFNPRWFYIVQSVQNHLSKKHPYWADFLGSIFTNLIQQHSHTLTGASQSPTSRLDDILWTSIGGLSSDDLWEKELPRGATRIRRETDPLVSTVVYRSDISFFDYRFLCPQFFPGIAAKAYHLKTVQGVQIDETTLKVFEAYADMVASACYWLPYRGFALMCERPIRISLDERVRLHNTDEKAIEWPDGYGNYALSGMKIPGEFITNPKSITPHLVATQPNAEIRRALIALYGEERFIKDANGHVVSHGKNGAKLWTCEFRPHDNAEFNDEPFQMVEVINSTPEPSGEFKHYFLRVPPDIQDADEAIAWTFGMEQQAYTPEKES